MEVDFVRLLYAYSAWANRHILSTAAQLATEQLCAKPDQPLPSIRDGLVHVMSAQQLWLQRWQGQPHAAMLNPADYADLAAIQTAWQPIEAATHAFVLALADGMLHRTVEYVTTEGQPKAFPLWQLMLHQVNHATQHRSEIALQLTQLGCSPGSFDLCYYIDDQQAR